MDIRIEYSIKERTRITLYGRNMYFICDRVTITKGIGGYTVDMYNKYGIVIGHVTVDSVSVNGEEVFMLRDGSVRDIYCNWGGNKW